MADTSTGVSLRGEASLRSSSDDTCVNWIRTSPYIKAWNRDYALLGLVVIGVHAPEFEFGKGAENIDRGIRDSRSRMRQKNEAFKGFEDVREARASRIASLPAMNAL